MPSYLHIKLTPNAKQNKIDGKFIDENGIEYLKVYTTSIAEDNKANKELIKIISKEYKIAKTLIKIVKGHKARLKILEIDEER
jgi:uncharacterized protein